jgi:hypothetical protein
MKKNLKPCGICSKETIIWKNHGGIKYCQPCWNKQNTVTGKDTKPTKRQTPIAPRSSKRAEQERKYSIVRRSFLLSSPLCKAKLPNRCTIKATEIHHIAGRIGTKLTDVENFLPVCRECHTWIEMNPLKAKELGLSKSKTNN